MKKKRTNGKYQSARTGKKKTPKGEKLLIAVLAAIVLLLCGLIAFMLLSLREQKKFEDLSAQVEEKQVASSTAPAVTESTRITEQTETTREPATVPTTVPETQPQMLEQYASLYNKNPDLYGWLRIEDTAVDYPVMYTPQEPEKYLHMDFDNEYSYSGVPFLEDGCTSESDNLIIYGHNMANGTMFRDLIKYEREDFWKEHPVIQFDTLYEQQEFEVLAAFYDRVYYKTETCFKFYQFIDAADEEDYNHAVSQFKEKALYDTGVEAAYGDRLITLVTCAYHTDNGRFVVVARQK